MKYNPKIVLAWFKEMGIPKPELEYKWHPTRKFRWDFAWPDLCVALEVDGGIWTGGAHGRGSGVARDMEKHNLAMAGNWSYLRVVPEELCLTDTADAVRLLLSAHTPSWVRSRNLL